MNGSTVRARKDKCTGQDAGGILVPSSTIDRTQSPLFALYLSFPSVERGSSFSRGVW